MSRDAKEVVVEFIRAAAEGRIEDSIALVDENCECWFTGGGRVSREFFVNGMRMLLAATSGPGPILIKEILQDGNRLAVEYENRFPLRNGRLYNNHYHSKFVVENGKLTVIREYLDSAHVAEVLQGIAPHLSGSA